MGTQTHTISRGLDSVPGSLSLRCGQLDRTTNDSSAIKVRFNGSRGHSLQSAASRKLQRQGVVTQRRPSARRDARSQIGSRREDLPGIIPSREELAEKVLVASARESLASDISRELDETCSPSCQISSCSSSDSSGNGSGGGSILGAMALITGTSVGAGILALPLETAPAGFLPSAVTLSCCWLFLSCEALLLAEVNVSLMRKRAADDVSNAQQATRASDVISLRTMAEETLGPLGGLFSSITYVFLSYTLMVAYIAKSADVLSFGNDLPMWLTGTLFTFGLGGVLFKGSTNTTDMINRVLTAGLLTLFGVIVLGGAFGADWSELSRFDWTSTPGMIPIVFLSLVFHDLVPVLCSYLEGDLPRIRKALIYGSLVPLAMFLSWDAVALAMSPMAGFEDPLQVLLRTGGPWQAATIKAFSLLAVATSFIGTSLSMSEFFMEQLGNVLSSSSSSSNTTTTTTISSKSSLQRFEASSEQPSFNLSAAAAAASSAMQKGMSAKLTRFGKSVAANLMGFHSQNQSEFIRFMAYLLVLLPPAAIAVATPDAFFAASEAAGAYGMTVLYGVFPPLMFWSLTRSTGGQQEDETVVPAFGSFWNEPGGSFALASLGACACGVIVGQAMLDTNAHLVGGNEVVLAATTGSIEEIASIEGVELSVPETAPSLIG